MLYSSAINDKVLNLYFIIALSIIFLFVYLFLVIYLKSTTINKYIHQKKWVMYLYDALVGGVAAIPLLAAFYWTKNYSFINSILFVSIGLGLLYYLSPWSMVSFSSILLIIWGAKYSQYEPNGDYYYLVATLLANVVFGTSLYFVKKKRINWLTPLLTFIVLLIYVAVETRAQSDWYLYLVVCHNFLFTWIYILISRLIYKFFEQTKQIKESVSYTYKYFLHQNFSKDKFYEFIKTNNIQYGHMVLIDCDSISSETAPKIIKKINEVFKNREKLFFVAKAKYFAFLDGTELSKEGVSQSFKTIAKDLIKENIEVDFLISTYGENSNLFEDLINYCSSLLKRNITNNAYLFNPKNYLIRNIDIQEVKLLDKIFPFMKSNISFVKKQYKNKTIVVPKIQYPDDAEVNKILDSLKSHKDTFERIISNLIVQSYEYSPYVKNSMLLLPYPKSYLNSSDFNFESFVSVFIHNFGRSLLDWIIITVNDIDPNKDSTAIKNLEIIKENHIQIGVDSDTSIKLFNYYLNNNLK